MEYLSEDIIKKIVVHSGESDEAEKIIKCEREAAVGPGENYCSNISRIYLQIKLKSGKVLDKTLVVKAFLQNLSDAAEKEMTSFFDNEATVYEKILIRLEELAKEHGLIEPNCWPHCFFANSRAIVFEDLKGAGFVVAPRHNGLNIEDSCKIIRYLGRLHALSLIAEKRNLIDPKLIRKTYPWTEVDSFIALFVKKALITAGDIISSWGGEWEDPGKKLIDFSKTALEVLNKLYIDPRGPKVLNHGDAWINNLMVKYNQEKTVVGLRFVDFQNAAYNTVGWDLTYFLYTSLQGELLRSNYDRLLTSYRDEFVDTLKSLGEDSALAPSIGQIKEDIERLHPFCLTMTCTVQPAVFNISKQPVQVEDLVKDEVKLRALFTSDTWKSTMKVHIKYFQQQNIL